MYVTEYNGEHSVVFGNKDSWKDWHLIPSSRPVFATPEVKTNFIDIPGADGGIDLSEALSGYPVYKNRNGSFKFLVDPNHMLTVSGPLRYKGATVNPDSVKVVTDFTQASTYGIHLEGDKYVTFLRTSEAFVPTTYTPAYGDTITFS